MGRILNYQCVGEAYVKLPPPLPPLPFSLTPQLCTKLAQGLVQGVTTQLQDLTSRKKGLLKKVHSSPCPIVTTCILFQLSNFPYSPSLIHSFSHVPIPVYAHIPMSPFHRAVVHVPRDLHEPHRQDRGQGQQGVPRVPGQLEQVR